nr:hypothetical protein Iba_scaffold3996CG0050 [Ipomoea batatas]
MASMFLTSSRPTAQQPSSLAGHHDGVGLSATLFRSAEWQQQRRTWAALPLPCDTSVPAAKPPSTFLLSLDGGNMSPRRCSNTTMQGGRRRRHDELRPPFSFSRDAATADEGPWRLSSVSGVTTAWANSRQHATATASTFFPPTSCYGSKGRPNQSALFRRWRNGAGQRRMKVADWAYPPFSSVRPSGSSSGGGERLPLLRAVCEQSTGGFLLAPSPFEQRACRRHGEAAATMELGGEERQQPPPTVFIILSSAPAEELLSAAATAGLDDVGSLPCFR